MPRLWALLSLCPSKTTNKSQINTSGIVCHLVTLVTQTNEQLYLLSKLCSKAKTEKYNCNLTKICGLDIPMSQERLYVI